MILNLEMMNDVSYSEGKMKAHDVIRISHVEEERINESTNDNVSTSAIL